MAIRLSLESIRARPRSCKYFDRKGRPAEYAQLLTAPHVSPARAAPRQLRMRIAQAPGEICGIDADQIGSFGAEVQLPLATFRPLSHLQAL